jgi:hypothetical protein
MFHRCSAKYKTDFASVGVRACPEKKEHILPGEDFATNRPRAPEQRRSPSQRRSGPQVEAGEHINTAQGRVATLRAT